MRGSSVIYFIKSAFQSIFKNIWMSLASMFVLIACMLIMGSAYLCSVNIGSFMTKLEAQNEIVAFVDDSVAEEDITALRDKIAAVDGVESVQFVSKEQALSEYRNSFDSQEDYLSGFEGDENPLRNEFRITILDLEKFDSISDTISEMPEIANIRDSQEVVDVLISLRRVMDILGFWIMIILAIVSLFIISNTIKLAMFNRRHEINIMKYVGATNWFIRWPFVLEGAIIGVFSSAVSFGLQWLIYVYLLKPLASKLDFLSASVLPFRQVYGEVLLIFACIGIIVGIFGSIFSIRKYLKV